MITSMSKSLVLLTGGTGHIGFKTLTTLLDSSYRVRICSRSLKRAEGLKAHPLLASRQDDVEFAEIPDMLAPDAFNTAVQGVDYIVHLASPIPEGEALKGDPRETMVQPAVHGTQNILTSALSSPSIKRVVIASSVAVLAPKDFSKPIGPNDLAPLPDLSTLSPDSPFASYSASKIMAHDTATTFMDTQNPRFDLVLVQPAYVQGRNDLLTRAADVRNGSNDVMMDLLLGKLHDTTNARYANTVLVDDVAHVFTQSLTIPLGEGVKRKNFLACGSPSGKGIEWDDVLGIVGRVYPEAVKEGKLDLGGTQKSLTISYDVSDSETAFGLKFKGLEEQVRSVVGQYLELLG